MKFSFLGRQKKFPPKKTGFLHPKSTMILFSQKLDENHSHLFAGMQRLTRIFLHFWVLAIRVWMPLGCNIGIPYCQESTSQRVNDNGV